jgi:hypothetical protein
MSDECQSCRSLSELSEFVGHVGACRSMSEHVGACRSMSDHVGACRRTSCRRMSEQCRTMSEKCRRNVGVMSYVGEFHRLARNEKSGTTNVVILGVPERPPMCGCGFGFAAGGRSANFPAGSACPSVCLSVCLYEHFSPWAVDQTTISQLQYRFK